MIRDRDLIMSNLQAVTVTVASTNIVDLTKPGDAIQTELYLVIRVGAAATAAGAATVTFDLQTDTVDTFASAVTLFSSGVIAKAALTINTIIIKVKLPVGVKQFLRVYYTVATGPLTAGTFDAFLTSDVNVA